MPPSQETEQTVLQLPGPAQVPVINRFEQLLYENLFLYYQLFILSFSDLTMSAGHRDMLKLNHLSQSNAFLHHHIIISGFGSYGAAVVPDSGVGNTWQRLTLVLHEFLSNCLTVFLSN